MENSRAVKKAEINNFSYTIDKRMEEVANSITTVDEWRDYIKKYYQPFCSILSKLETKSSKNKACTANKQISVITGCQPGAG